MTETITSKQSPRNLVFSTCVKIRDPRESEGMSYRMRKDGNLPVISQSERQILTAAIFDILREDQYRPQHYGDFALVAKFLGLKKEARALAEMAYEDRLKVGYFLDGAVFTGKGTWALKDAKAIAAEHHLSPLTVLRLQLAALKRTDDEVKRYHGK